MPPECSEKGPLGPQPASIRCPSGLMATSFPADQNPVTGADPPVSHATPQPIPADASPELVKASSQLQDLGHRIELLQDHDAIEKVQRAYGYYVDKAEWPDVADLYQEPLTQRSRRR